MNKYCWIIYENGKKAIVRKPNMAKREWHMHKLVDQWCTERAGKTKKAMTQAKKEISR
jgi:hypothetical protein